MNFSFLMLKGVQSDLLVFLKMFLKIVHSSMFQFYFSSYFNPLLYLRGDFKVNPGPNRKPNKTLLICLWKLNSTSAHKFAKFHVLKAYVTVHKFNIICLSKTYLHSNTPFDNYLQLLVILIQNLDIGITKTLILLKGFQLKIQCLNLDNKETHAYS